MTLPLSLPAVLQVNGLRSRLLIRVVDADFATGLVGYFSQDSSPGECKGYAFMNRVSLLPCEPTQPQPRTKN